MTDKIYPQNGDYIQLLDGHLPSENHTTVDRFIMPDGDFAFFVETEIGEDMRVCRNEPLDTDRRRAWLESPGFTYQPEYDPRNW